MKKLIFLLLIASSYISAQNPLAIPSTLTGTNISLTLQEGTTIFHAGITTNTMGANGDLLGPTLILDKGDFVSFSVNNQLNDTTTMHWHGMHVSSENDGGPHTKILPGSIWSPQFNILDKAGTFWYHPHLHHHTDKHVSKGIAGMILVRDNEEVWMNLPLTYGVDEFPIIMQTKGFDAAGQIEVHTEMDTSVMVNGTINPIVNFPAQVVRLRVLNGSSQRVMDVGFTGNKPFSLIGTDGGLLTTPVSLTRYRMAPGQRADILIDLSSDLGQNFQLMSYGSELPNGVYGAIQPGIQTFQVIPGYVNNPLNGSNFQLLDINVVSQTTSPILTIPTTLANFTPLDENTASLTRDITFSVSPTAVDFTGPFLINNTSFDMNIIRDTIQYGATEIWRVTNNTGMAHPFHIHDVQFFILTINGIAPPQELQGYNDVVLIPGGFTEVRFIAKFDDFLSPVPYMYHCHMLTHEDHGMMGQFIVSGVVPLDIPETLIDLKKIIITPNPTKGELNISKLKNIKTIRIKSIDGKLIKEIIVNNRLTLKINMDTNKGIYFLEIINNNGMKSIRKIIHH